VLGAKVASNGQKEIGWFDVRLTQNAALSPFFVDFKDIFPAFHWHGDRFSCPPRALRIALSAACDQQAFVYDERVLGLQFHLETTEETAQALIAHCAVELAESGPAIQAAGQMLAQPVRFAQLNRLMDALLGRMAEAVERRT
jgi:GMP synthase (glutamine-hydrolysing)